MRMEWIKSSFTDVDCILVSNKLGEDLLDILCLNLWQYFRKRLFVENQCGESNCVMLL